MRRVHDGRVEPRLHAVVQENRIENAARLRRQPEADVRNTEDCRDARELALDETDSLDRVLAGIDPFRIARRKRERQRVIDEILGGESVLTDHDVVDLLRYLELPLASLRHTDLVDRERNHGSSVLLNQRHDCVDTLAAVLHVDRIDDAATRDVLERGFDHIGLGRIDHQRRLHAHRQQLHHLRHLLGFVGPLGESDANVEHVRARIDLITRMAELTRGTWLGCAGFARGSTARTAPTIAERCAGVVPQQPPTMRTPKSLTNSESAVAIGSGSSGYTASPTPVLSGSPAFGITDKGSVACSDKYRMGSRMCSGPVEQFRPITSTLSASSVVIALAMSVPRSMRPLTSSVTWVWRGIRRPISENSLSIPATAAFTSRMSCDVSMRRRSTPPSTRYFACS